MARARGTPAGSLNSSIVIARGSSLRPTPAGPCPRGPPPPLTPAPPVPNAPQPPRGPQPSQTRPQRRATKQPSLAPAFVINVATITIYAHECHNDHFPGRLERARRPRGTWADVVGVTGVAVREGEVGHR